MKSFLGMDLLTKWENDRKKQSKDLIEIDKFLLQFEDTSFSEYLSRVFSSVGIRFLKNICSFLSQHELSAINPLRDNPQRSQQGNFCSCEYVYKYADGKSFEPI